MENSIEKLTEFFVLYGPKVIGAILVLIIGLWVIKVIMKGFAKMMDNRDVSPSLKPFLISMAGIILKILLVVSVLGMVGVEVTSFIAILGAAGLALGLALSGTLQNFAGGVMILLFKPYEVGHFIEAQGYTGTVDEIQIFNTIMSTPDNRVIIIPNGGLSTGSMINYSARETRRVDWTFGIGYGDGTGKAKETLMELINSDSRIKKDPEPFVAVSELADSSVNFAVRVWVDSADYWGVFFDMNEKVYNTFGTKGLNIPYPQMDVHVHNKA